MKTKILFIERRACEFVSLENVFASVAAGLDTGRFSTEFVKLPYGNGILGIILNLLFFRPPAADVYHITGHIHYIALALPADRTVLTIHDLGILRQRRGIRRWLLTRLLVKWPLRRLRFVTAISEQTVQEIRVLGETASTNVSIVENPVQPHFLTGTSPKFNAERPVILHVGTMPNKNLDTLAVALEGLDINLRIIGKLSEAQSDDLSRRGIQWTAASELTDEEIRLEYESADIVSFCSLYEGFGLPIVEAQAMARPVVTSNLSPMREVAGKGALLVNPRDPSEIKMAIRRLIEEPDIRASLVNEGLENISRFRPETIAARYADLYDSILKPDNSSQSDI